MGELPKTDDEILDYILGLMYSNNEYPVFNEYAAVSLLEKFDINHWDVQRLWRYLNNSNLIRQKYPGSSVDHYILSDKGMALMRKHSSYLKYLESEKQPTLNKEKIERNDRRVKNIGILATLGISLLTLILTQCPKRKETLPEKTEEGIQLISTKLDSLLKVLPHTQTEKENKSIEDTATNK